MTVRGLLTGLLALAFAIPAGAFVSRRPAPDQRCFVSTAVEAKIADVQRRLGDTKLAWLFANCFPNTLDTTVSYTVLPNGDDDTFVVTGDIPAMWLRDSAAQVWPYLPLAKDDEPLRHLIRGVILRQFACLRLDPYANAFNRGCESGPWQDDMTDMKPGLHERKYELDSLCYPLRLAHGYWKATGDTSIFDARWLTTLDLILAVMREQQRKEGPRTSYRFQRRAHAPTDTLANGGYGWPAKPCGLIASAFRPSDDATTYPFLVPSNFFAVDVLRKAAEILTAVNRDATRAAACTALADEVEAALYRHAVFTHPKYGQVFAFEVDGYGNALFIDDANVPSLLALPYFSAVSKEDPIYLNTRRLVWGPDNPYYFEGHAGAGIGGPHCGLDNIWPMSYVLRALTATSPEEVKACLAYLERSDAGTGFMHEAYNKNDPAAFTRPWFAWANTLFGELILTLLDAGVEVVGAPIEAANVFVGTSGTGHTTPAACRPFALVQAGPDTGVLDWKYCSGYQADDTSLLGFSCTHLSGAGCADLGDVRLLPFTRETLAPPERLAMDKASERGSPGSYAVNLPTEGVTAEMTATPRVGYFRFGYPAEQPAKLLVDLQYGIAVFSSEGLTNRVTACTARLAPDGQGLEAALEVANWTRRNVFTVLRFSRPAAQVTELPPTNPCERAPRYIFTFAPSADPLEVKVALSTTDLDGARRNLAAELPRWDFPAARQAARAAWEEVFARVDVKAPARDRATFYSALYRLAVQPHDLTDVDGRYRGADGAVHRARVHYGELSLWDTYRAAHPLYTLLFPERVDGFVASLVAQSQQQGYLPVWPLWGRETDCMVGNPAVSVIADAYLKGFRGFDAEAAFAAVSASLDVRRDRSRADLLERYGYIPYDEEPTESVSMTLEDAVNCDGAARLAAALGKPAAAARYARRAQGYRRVFDPETGFVRGRAADGSWRTPFEPLRLCNGYALGGDFTEGNAWQYLWLVPHDPDGLVALLGGKEAFFARLDQFFALPARPAGLPELADATGFIGQYAHGNEPSHHIAYLFAREGRPARTQELVREICDRFYSPSPEGLCGNEDGGQMSAWYLFTALGFYPLNPVGGDYVLGAPQVPEATIALPNGKRLEIRAPGLSAACKYVASVTFNGRPIDGPVIRHADLVNGGTLVFTMTDRPM